MFLTYWRCLCAENFKVDVDDFEYIIGRIFFPRGRVWKTNEVFEELHALKLTQPLSDGRMWIHHDAICEYLYKHGVGLSLVSDRVDLYDLSTYGFLIFGDTNRSFKFNKFKFTNEKHVESTDLVFVHDGKLKSLDISTYQPIDINVHKHVKLENKRNWVTRDDCFYVGPDSYFRKVHYVYKIELL